MEYNVQIVMKIANHALGMLQIIAYLVLDH